MINSASQNSLICADKWLEFNHNCYYISAPNNNTLDKGESQQSCASAGAHLFVPNSKDEWVMYLT